MAILSFPHHCTAMGFLRNAGSLPLRFTLLQWGLGLLVVGLAARAFILQVVQGPRWAAQATADRYAVDTLPAPRGALLDRFGRILAATEPAYRLDVAPGEFLDTTAATDALSAVTGLSSRDLGRQFTKNRYLYYHGPYSAAMVAPIRDVRGIHLQQFWRRRYAAGGTWSTLLGTTVPDDPQIGAAGVERALDVYLRGTPGRREWLKDARGRRYGMPGLMHVPPAPGCDVTLTIDAEVQELAEDVLREGVAAHNADGGDLVIVDPATGDVLALAGITRSASGGWRPKLSPLTDPFEPGSTAKIFTAAAVLEFSKITSKSTVPGRNGTWTMAVGRGRSRTLTDVHRISGPVSLHEAIQYSSNVAISGFAMQHLTPEQQYHMLTQLGVGKRTGIELGREASGTLRPVSAWQPLLTMPSLAMGYEMQMTSLQLAAAYAAIGNHGIAHSPRVVRDISCRTTPPQPPPQTDTARVVMRPEVADSLVAYLVDVVGAAGGTARRAEMNFTQMAGKTGTAIQVVDGRYQRGRYTASFAALVPARDPIASIVVKLDNPRGTYYGGSTAAPMARRLVEQLVVADMRDDRWRAMAARSVPEAPRIALDRQAGTDFLPPTRVVAFDPTTGSPTVNAPSAPEDVRASLVGMPVPECIAAGTAAGWLVRTRGSGRYCGNGVLRGDTLVVTLTADGK